MRISDGSSDVCSSDLLGGYVGVAEGHGLGHVRRVAKACGGSKRILAGLFIDRGPGPLPHPASHVQYTEWEAGWGSGPGPHLTDHQCPSFPKSKPPSAACVPCSTGNESRASRRGGPICGARSRRTDEHTSELTSLMRLS